jgi:hypothetical protein
MPRRRKRAGRSATDWSVRCLLAASALITGYASVSQTLAFSLRTSDARRAHALAPGDGRITALLARQTLGVEATASDRARADRLARVAVLQDPTAVPAVATLGLDAQLNGDVGRSRRLFAYVQTLSRRDIPTQIWAIEDAVARGNVKEALTHYDIALRVSRTAPDLLFPILASAIADPAVRAALIQTLAARPAWGQAFLGYVSVRGPDSRATARLLTGVRRAGLPVSQGASAELINLLIFNGYLDEAWSYYASVRPKADRRRSRDSGFDADLSDPSPLDWIPVNDGGVVTSIQRSDTGGIFDFAAPASIGGPLLRQVQLLPPATYKIRGHSRAIDQPKDSLPYWTLSCRDGRELGRVVLPASALANGWFEGGFVVPADCPIQTLTLVARAADTVSGLSGQIDQVQLSPAS